MNDIVVIADAVRTYPRGVEEIRAIDGVDLSIERGDFVAVVGRSGSGKTTLLNLIGCVDLPTEGKVTVHGVETGNLPDKALATIRSTTIGFVFQQFFLIPTLTALENVMVPGRFRAGGNGDLKTRARELLDMVGLADRVDHLPHELSGGEMQRVALARALINDPAILLADEPTGNLDTRSAQQIAEIFEELNARGLTIVVVTHSPELTGNARRVLQLQDGKFVADERMKPVPVREAQRPGEDEPEPLTVPRYMPSSLKRRNWGSPAAAAAMVLLGALTLTTAFMPFIGKFSGIDLMERGFFAVEFYVDNYLTRIIASEPATILTGLWPLVLGLLLAAAGVLFLFNLQRIGRWSALAIGVCATAVAAVDILMIQNRLGEGVAVEYGLWVLLGAGIATVVLAAMLFVLARYGNRGTAGREATAETTA
ncbi:MAG: ABC transporter ATP-binding protein [Actinomycetota bacterium]